MPSRSEKSTKTIVQKRTKSISPDKKLDSNQAVVSPIEHVLHLQRTIGNRAVQHLVESGIFLEKPGKVLPGENSVAVRERIQPHSLVQKDGKGVADSGMAWNTLVSRAKAALGGGQLKTANKLYSRAILTAVSGVAFPDGLTKLVPKLSDIQLDFSKSKRSSVVGFEDAYTDGLQVEKYPTDYWKWIFFTSKSLRASKAYTEALITHELVHVGQYQKQWKAYQASGKKGSWEMYIRSLPGGAARQKGPVELAGHITGLDFVKRMKPAEQRTVLRSIFEHYLHTSTYVPPKGVAPEITAADAKTKIMSAFNKAGKGLQKQMGTALWGAIIGVSPSKTTWKKLLRDLRPIVFYGYKAASPGVRKLYREMMALDGLSFK